MTSVPGVQTQPPTSPFATSFLNSFWPGSPTSPLFTNDPAGRAAALAAGFVVPPYDPNKPSKCYTAGIWPQDIPCGYYDGTGTWQPMPLAIPFAELNIWGPTEYPKYAPASTPALYMGLQTNAGGFAGQLPCPPAMLSTQDQANQIALAWGLTAVAIRDESTSLMFTANGETRRIWMIDVLGSLYNVGEKIAEMNAKGVGAPGKWQGQVWVADDSGPGPVSPAGPIPQRQLLPNERLQANSMMDPKLMVFTTPLAAESAPSTGAGATLSAYQAAQLTNIESILVQLATQRMGLAAAVTPKV